MRFIVNAFNGNEKLWKVIAAGFIPQYLLVLLADTNGFLAGTPSNTDKSELIVIIPLCVYSILFSIPVFKCALNYNRYIFLLAACYSFILFVQPIVLLLVLFGFIEQ